MTDPPKWWQWPTILSIDAPIVAVLWQLLIARVAAVDLSWPGPLVLALSVWLAYAADRWIEGFRLDAAVIGTPRHHFYQRYRWPAATVWLIVVVVDVGVALTYLDTRDIAAGLALVAAVSVYLLSHQLVHRNHAWRAPKELCVAALLTGGVVVFLTESEHVRDLMIPVVLFALLCFTNCALISLWERDVDRAHGQTSLALGSNGNADVIRQLPWITAVLAACAAVVGNGAAQAAALSTVVSALMLALIDHLERRSGRQPARVLADAALMTPAIALWLYR